MAFGLLHALQLSVARGALASWYPSGLMTYWIGLVGLAYALWSFRPSLPSLALRAGPIWSIVVVLSLVPLYGTSNLTYDDKVDSMLTRSPVAAACVRHYRDAPAYCVPIVAPVTAPAPTTATSLTHLAEPLERHHLSVFAPHEEWTLQGEYILDTVHIAQMPGVPAIAWSPDLTLTTAPWWDCRHLNLLLAAPNSLTWTLTLPATLTHADFQSAVAISTAASAPDASGVNFALTLNAGDGKEQPLFNRHLAAGEHRWQPFTVPLGAYAGQTVTLRLSTTADAGARQAFGMFHYPTIVLDRVTSPESAALPAAVQPTDHDLRLDLANTRQWQPKNMTVVTGAANTWIVSRDPTFIPAQSLNACLADYTHLTIQMSASADIYQRTASILFGLNGAEPTNEIDFSLYADGDLHTYTFDLTLLGAGPEAQLTSLRVPDARAGSPGSENRVQITDLRLVGGAKSGGC